MNKELSKNYAEIKAYYHGGVSFSYRCSYCLYSNDGTPGKTCKGCGRILIEKNDDSSEVVNKWIEEHKKPASTAMLTSYKVEVEPLHL